MNRSIPDLRFKEFSNLWEVKEFKDFVFKAGEKNKNGEDYPSYSISNKLGLVSQTEQFEDSRLDNLDKKDYRLVNPNEFAYNPARINVGSIAFNNLGSTVIVSSLYVVLKMSNEIDNEYIFQFIKSSNFTNEVKRNTEGSVREYLFFENFKNVKFPYTPNYEEQMKIGGFLKKLDNIISLQQEFVNLQKRYKRTMLKKMFPQKDECVPRVRFKGFSNDWKETLFEDLFKVSSGYAFKKADYIENGISLVNGESIQHGEIFSDAWNYLPEEFLEKYENFILKTDDIVLGLNRPITNNQLKIARVPESLNNSLLYQRAGKIVFKKENINKEFSYQLLENEIFRFVLKEAVGSDQPFISTTKLDKWSFLYPTDLNEQQKIGNFFKELNATIGLHEKKLANYQQLKKTLLQKMFI